MAGVPTNRNRCDHFSPPTAAFTSQAQNPPIASHYTWNKTQNPAIVSKAVHKLALKIHLSAFISYPHSLLRPFSNTAHSCSVFAICHSFCLEHSATIHPQSTSPTPFKSRHQRVTSSERHFLDKLLQTAALHPAILYPFVLLLHSADDIWL